MLLVLALLCGVVKPLDVHQRSLVKVSVLDAENLLVQSKETIETLYLDDMYVNTDYMRDHDPQKDEIRIRLLTSRGPLKIVVETLVPGTKVLRRKHRINVRNPIETSRR